SNGHFVIAEVYDRQRDYTNALKNYSAALEIYEEIGMSQGIANSNIGIGNIFYALSDYHSALEHHFIALNILKNVGDKTGMAFCYNSIGAAYIQLNRVKEGKNWLQKGLSIHKETNTKEGIKFAYEFLSKADSALGNFRRAYENHKMFTVYKDSLSNEENTRKLTEIRMQYEFDKKEAATKAKQQEEKEKMKLRYSIAILIIFIIALTGFLLLYFTRIKKKKEKQIFLANRQIIELEKEKVEAQLIQARKDVEQFLNKINEKDQLISKIVAELKRLQQNYDDKKSELTKTLNELRHTSILTDEDWSRFLSGFDKLYPEFTLKIRTIQPKITTSELRFLMLAKIGLSTQRMAATLGVSPNSVRVTWKRVKGKLNASPEDTPQSLLKKIENMPASASL
ncbi:MAG TPA: tetratricopeptide repeat protein, partial [Aquaticitalea sp.]|nr:tetratricopeptide repeat protein [Aquaticitalea sp.]